MRFYKDAANILPRTNGHEMGPTQYCLSIDERLYLFVTVGALCAVGDSVHSIREARAFEMADSEAESMWIAFKLSMYIKFLNSTIY